MVETTPRRPVSGPSASMIGRLPRGTDAARPSLRRRAEALRARVRERLRSAAGFTLVELMIALMLLGVLSAVLIVQLSNTGDRAMGTTARMDVRSLMAALSADQAYRLAAGDAQITQEDVNTVMGLSDNGQDASGSKTILLGIHDAKTLAHDPNPRYITYHYRRGDLILTAVISLDSGDILWKVTGLNQPRRLEVLCEGLKIDAADLLGPSGGPVLAPAKPGS